MRTIVWLILPTWMLAQGLDFDKARVATGAPGAAMAILSGGKVEIQISGAGSVETGALIGPDTLFRIASTSKMFLGAAFAVLVQQGRIDLNAPIGKYAKGLSPAMQSITLHQLLTHTSGLADDAPMEGPHDESALAERVRGWGPEAFFTEPGKIFSYSNAGYALAGYVLEQVYGKPFADAIRDLVLEPCGMTSSTYRPLMAMTFSLALGHHPTATGPFVIRPFADHAGAWPSGSLFTSAREFSRFAQALLEGGRVEGKQVLPAAAIELIQTPHVLMPGLGRGYGYGLQVFEENHHKVVRHTGGRIGYDSVLHLMPAEKVGVLVLANQTGASFYSFSRRVAESAAHLPPAPGEDLPSGVPVTEAAARRIAGRYVNSRAISAELAWREGALQASIGGRWVAVLGIGSNRFLALGAGPMSAFKIVDGTNGRPEFLVAEAWALRRQE